MVVEEEGRIAIRLPILSLITWRPRKVRTSLISHVFPCRSHCAMQCVRNPQAAGENRRDGGRALTLVLSLFLLSKGRDDLSESGCSRCPAFWNTTPLRLRGGLDPSLWENCQRLYVQHVAFFVDAGSRGVCNLHVGFNAFNQRCFPNPPTLQAQLTVRRRIPKCHGG